MRGAIFDMDGLLLDSERLYQIAWHELADREGVTLPPTFAAEITGSGWEEARRILRLYYPQSDPAVLMRDCKTRLLELEAEDLQLKPGAAEVLPALRAAGWRLAVASSSPREIVEENLTRTGIIGYFDALISGGDVKNGKPAPDIFLLAAARLGLPPEDCCVFEDSVNGLRAARAARCRPVMIPDQVPPTDELLTFCEVYPNLTEAWERIKNEEVRMKN